MPRCLLTRHEPPKIDASYEITPTCAEVISGALWRGLDLKQRLPSVLVKKRRFSMPLGQAFRSTAVLCPGLLVVRFAPGLSHALRFTGSCHDELWSKAFAALSTCISLEVVQTIRARRQQGSPRPFYSPLGRLPPRGGLAVANHYTFRWVGS